MVSSCYRGGGLGTHHGRFPMKGCTSEVERYARLILESASRGADTSGLPPLNTTHRVEGSVEAASRKIWEGLNHDNLLSGDPPKRLMCLLARQSLSLFLAFLGRTYRTS